MKSSTTTSKKSIQDIIKETSIEILDWIRKGELIDISSDQLNPHSNVSYKGMNKIWLSLTAKKQNMLNNQWLTKNQIEAEKGELKKGVHYTMCFKSSTIFKYKDESGKMFDITAFSRIEADILAKEKTAEPIYIGQRQFTNYFRLYNVTQTTLEQKYPPKNKFNAAYDPMEARRLVGEQLDKEDDFFDRKLITLLGAACLTQIVPTADELLLVEAWLKKLDEKPSYLYWLSKKAYKVAGNVLDSVLEDIA